MNGRGVSTWYTEIKFLKKKKKRLLPVAHMFGVGIVTAYDNEHVLEM